MATLDEAIRLRGAVPPPAEIAVLNGLLPGTPAVYREHALLPVLNDPGQVAMWPAEHAAILQVDTGMARLGLDPAALPREPRRWRLLMSHLACADEPDNPKNAQQRSLLELARQQLPGTPVSLAASFGIFLGPVFGYDLVRPGVALYGGNPTPGHLNPMQQVVHLQGRILQVRDIDRGESVGYGAAHTMSRKGRLATVGVGYADGWLRALSQGSSGRIGRVRVPLVGRVSMDLTIFDVTDADPALARPGALVSLIDETHDIDAVAREAGTIGYEILTALGSRYHRVYLG